MTDGTRAGHASGPSAVGCSPSFRLFFAASHSATSMLLESNHDKKDT